MTRTVLVIDDEDNMRWVLERALGKAGYEVLTASRGSQGLELFSLHPVDLVLVDLKMPGMDGLAVLREIRRTGADVPILLFTAYATVPTAVEAMRVGATDYLRKPFDLEDVLAKVHHHLTAAIDQSLAVETPAPLLGFGEFVGAHPALLQPLSLAASAAQLENPVLLCGPVGSGRRHLARLIHRNGAGNGAARLLVVDCQALPSGVVDAAFLPAVSDTEVPSPGQKVLGGSLLLANADALPPALAQKLSTHFARLLRTPKRPHGLRLLLTAEKAVDPAWDDLLNNALAIELPALCQRLNDLPLLLAEFAPGTVWSSGIRALLAAYAWPRNVAELKRVAEQAARLAADDMVEMEHLPSHLQEQWETLPGHFILPPEGIQLDEVEQDLIRQALALAHGNKTQAARLLGLSRATLLYRLDKYGLNDEGNT